MPSELHRWLAAGAAFAGEKLLDEPLHGLVLGHLEVVALLQNRAKIGAGAKLGLIVDDGRVPRALGSFAFFGGFLLRAAVSVSFRFTAGLFFQVELSVAV